MRSGIWFFVAAALVAVPTLAVAQKGGIKADDAMGGKDRPSADGWVQAPIPRTDAPSGETPGEGKANRSADAQTRAVPDTGKKLSPGQDPGTPEATPNAGPATR